MGQGEQVDGGPAGARKPWGVREPWAIRRILRMARSRASLARN